MPNAIAITQQEANMNASEVKVETIATVKIGRNEVEVTVIEITADGWKVKSNSSGRKFEV